MCVQPEGKTYAECVSKKPASVKSGLPRTVGHSAMLTAAPICMQTAASPAAEARHQPLRYNLATDTTCCIDMIPDFFQIPYFLIRLCISCREQPVGTTYTQGAAEVHTSTAELVRDSCRASTSC
jgi:hypothetical protein